MSSLNIAEEMGVTLPERATTTTHATQPFLWSIRRELWENPSIVVAPAAVASLLVIATLVAAVRFTGPLLLKLAEKNLALSTVAIVIKYLVELLQTAQQFLETTKQQQNQSRR